MRVYQNDMEPIIHVERNRGKLFYENMREHRQTHPWDARQKEWASSVRDKTFTGQRNIEQTDSENEFREFYDMRNRNRPSSKNNFRLVSSRESRKSNHLHFTQVMIYLIQETHENKRKEEARKQKGEEREKERIVWERKSEVDRRLLM